MKKKKFLLLSIIFTVLLAFLVVGTVLGQEPDPNEGIIATPEPAELPDEVDQGSEGQVEAADEVGPLAQPPYTMNYQGYLTDSSGNPLNGTYDLVFRLYDAAAAGNLEWGPEAHNNVQVTNGLFQVTLGTSVTLYPNDFDEALFLAVWVNGTAVTPRQPLRSVPYAFGLVPGAEVEGDPDGIAYALSVRNTGTGSSDTGLYAQGNQYGIYAEESGSGDIGIYSPDFVQAQGYRSNDDSYLWIPATLAVYGQMSSVADLRMSFETNGSVTVQRIPAGTGDENIFIPIAIPAVLYGQNVDVEQVAIYYRCSNANSYITSTYLNKQTAASTMQTIISNTTDRTATSNASYALVPSPTELSSSAGSLNVNLVLTFANNTDTIRIGGVRLRLGHR